MGSFTEAKEAKTGTRLKLGKVIKFSYDLAIYSGNCDNIWTDIELHTAGFSVSKYMKPVGGKKNVSSLNIGGL